MARIEGTVVPAMRARLERQIEDAALRFISSRTAYERQLQAKRLKLLMQWRDEKEASR